MRDKTIEVLVKRIEELEARNEKLEKEHEDARYKEEWRWRHIRSLTAEENGDLPVPRLELRHQRLSEYRVVIHYGLVIQHLTGWVTLIPIGSTDVGGALARASDELYIPLRDGAIIRHDMKTLNLPAFIVSDSRVAPIRE